MNTAGDSIVCAEDAGEAAGDSAKAIEVLVGCAGGAEGAGSHYERSRLVVVTAGQAVARILPGADVKLGENVALDGDGVTVRAVAAGVLRVEGNSVRVAQAVELAGDVDFSTGNIDCPHDVLVRGSILDLFRVRSGGTVHVGRSIEAAEVCAAGDIVAGQAIAGKEKGRCIAGGSVRAKLMTAAHIEAGGDVAAVAEIAHCRIVCGGALRAPGAAVYGGEIAARGGAVCGELGCAGGARTIIAAGIDQELRRLAGEHVPRVLAEMRQAAKVRQTVEPLLRNQRSLTAQQKEKATELLFQAGEMEERNRSVVETLRRRREESRLSQREEIRVLKTLYAGVVVRFAELEAAVPCDTGGPVSLVPRRRAGGGHIAMVVAGGREVMLETRSTKDETMRALEELLTMCGGEGAGT